MGPFRRLAHRVVPALMVAGGVTLLASGLLTFTADPSDAFLGASGSATPSLVAIEPDVSDEASPSEPVEPSASLSAAPGTGVLPTPSPSSTKPPRAVRATRVVFPSLRIDLPVVSGEYQVRGNRDNYPLCDVAQYLVVFQQPNRDGVTYLYGHARVGMFLPLLESSRRNNGAGMLGALVQVYTNEPRVYLYEVIQVEPLTTKLPSTTPRKGQRLLYLQTSTGPHGTVPKLQVIAKLVASQVARKSVAEPKPHPRACPP